MSNESARSVKCVKRKQSKVWKYLKLRQRQIANISKEGPKYLEPKNVGRLKNIDCQQNLFICHVDEDGCYSSGLKIRRVRSLKVPKVWDRIFKIEKV